MCNIPLVYLSSLSETATHVNQGESLYNTFMFYFMDYRPPNFFSMSMTYIVSPEGSTNGSLVEKKISYIQRTISLKGVDVTIVIPDNHVHLLISNRCEQTQFWNKNLEFYNLNLSED